MLRIGDTCTKHMFTQEFANQAYVYTILPKDTTQVYALGQRSELSFYDHKIVNLAYCNGRKTLIFELHKFKNSR
jgi:predicted nucleic acid-binding protein